MKRRQPATGSASEAEREWMREPVIGVDGGLRGLSPRLGDVERFVDGVGDTVFREHEARRWVGWSPIALPIEPASALSDACVLARLNAPSDHDVTRMLRRTGAWAICGCGAPTSDGHREHYRVASFYAVQRMREAEGRGERLPWIEASRHRRAIARASACEIPDEVTRSVPQGDRLRWLPIDGLVRCCRRARATVMITAHAGRIQRGKTRPDDPVPFLRHWFPFHAVLLVALGLAAVSRRPRPPTVDDARTIFPSYGDGSERRGATTVIKMDPDALDELPVDEHLHAWVGAVAAVDRWLEQSRARPVVRPRTTAPAPSTSTRTGRDQAAARMELVLGTSAGRDPFSLVAIELASILATSGKVSICSHCGARFSLQGGRRPWSEMPVCDKPECLHWRKARQVAERRAKRRGGR